MSTVTNFKPRDFTAWTEAITDESFNEAVPVAVSAPRAPARAPSRFSELVAVAFQRDEDDEDASTVMYDPRRFPFSIEMSQEILPEGFRIRLTARQAD